jgi:hypothetical protein
MEGEKKDDGTGDPFKLLIEESLTQQRNEMMDNFVQILRRLPTGDASSSSGGTAPFKVQINFDIPIFEGQIDADVVDKWLNLLEGYFSVHNFSNREKITFALLKEWTTLRQERDQVVPDLTNIFDTLCTKLGIKDSERHMVLKYRGALHRYIQTEMKFLDISSLGAAYRYAVKIEGNLKQKT